SQTFLLPEFETEEREKPVNVASVPQRSPFRYPGGKTWLVPLFRRWMMSLPSQPAVLVEPFAGGGIISLTSAFEQLADRVVMVELDEQISSVWKTILGGDADWLAKRILSFELTTESAKEEFCKKPRSQREIAFQTILKNRTAHGGILAEGAGVLKHGENGKGILSDGIRRLSRSGLRTLNSSPIVLNSSTVTPLNKLNDSRTNGAPCSS